MSSSLKRLASSSFLLAVAFIALPLFGARAQEPEPVYGGPELEIPIPNVDFTSIIRENGQITIPWLAQYISGVYTFLLSIAGLLAASMMIYGGFQYLTSAGDKGKIAAGKKKIVDAMTGLLLALSSYIILFSINPDLVEFSGLNVTGVDQKLLTFETGIPEELVEKAPSQSSSTPSIRSGKLARFCDWAPGMPVKPGKTDCAPVCKNWGCGTEISESNCDFSKMPKEATGAINPDSPDLIPASKWPKMKNVKPRGSSPKATSAVIAGLQRASDYIDTAYAGKGYTIQISNCWRDWRKDAAKECGIVIGDHIQYKGGPIDHNPNNYALAWPGVGPHSSGAACDMQLLHNGNVISGTKGSNQNCSSKQSGNQILIDIMTNTTVGAKRLNFEAWHFEWDGPTGCRCVGAACTAIKPISIPKCSSGTKQPNTNC